MGIESVLFYVLAGLALSSALALVAFCRSGVPAALCLALTLLPLAGIYVLLGAHFVAIVQVLVFVGAVVVLLLFSIMLLDPEGDAFEAPRPEQPALKLLGILVVLAISLLLWMRVPVGLPPVTPVPEGFGLAREFGLRLLADYLVVLEAVGLILLAAMVGAVILAKRRID
ncbi:MAG: NADH-quinone oxidoreductase subunit J [Deltaproteobacteria bacterium]|nr:NADH-quinone oxidoreductase subunit J [Deltaproteobacteria bacterium]